MPSKTETIFLSRQDSRDTSRLRLVEAFRLAKRAFGFLLVIPRKHSTGDVPNVECYICTEAPYVFVGTGDKTQVPTDPPEIQPSWSLSLGERWCGWLGRKTSGTSPLFSKYFHHPIPAKLKELDFSHCLFFQGPELFFLHTVELLNQSASLGHAPRSCLLRPKPTWMSCRVDVIPSRQSGLLLVFCRFCGFIPPTI